MQINQSTLAALYKGYRTVFFEAMHGAQPQWSAKGLAMRTPSGAAEEIYHWLGAVSGMKELVGEVSIENLRASNFTIKNKEWEDTVAVKQADVERDSYGIYNPRFQMLGNAAAEHPDELLSDLLINGFTSGNNDYTGTTFFNTSKKHHPSDKSANTFSNKLTGVLSAANYKTARQMLLSMKNGKGRPMNLGRKAVLIVPPALEETGRTILEMEFVEGSSSNMKSNPQRGTAELWVWPRLAGNDTKWFLADLGLPVKPLIFQEEKAPELSSLTSMDSDHVFKFHEYLYQVYGRWNGGYGMPQLIIGSTGAG